MTISAARNMRDVNVPNDFDIIREISARDLDDLFRQATADAARQALGQGLPVTGIDESGRIVVTNHAIRVDLISTKRE